jgi:hypothetical protein
VADKGALLQAVLVCIIFSMWVLFLSGTAFSMLTRPEKRNAHQR